MKSKTTIGKKFTLTAGFLLILMGGLGIGSLLSINSLSRSVNTIVTGPLPGVERICKVDSLIFQFRGDTWKHIASADLSAKLAAEANQKKIRPKIESILQDYEKTISSARDRALFQIIRPLYERYVQVIESEVLPLSRAGKPVEARSQYLLHADPLHAELKTVVLELVEYNRSDGEADSTDATRVARNGRVLIIGMLISTLFVASALVFFMIRSVNLALSDIAVVLCEGAEQLKDAAGQFSTGSQSLAQGASEQAASLEETSASVAEINGMAINNSEKSRAAVTLVVESQEKFRETHSKLDQLVATMANARASSEKIASIIRVIDGIASNTNILALNAAVEAARAGAAGTGFAVVADEVRNLAQRSAQAAKDTAALIEESIAAFFEGSDRVDHVAKGIHTLSEQSLQVKELIDDVHKGSEEQAKAIMQVTNAMGQMEQVTQSTAANAEETASAAEELSAQSNTLMNSVEQLTALVGTKALS